MDSTTATELNPDALPRLEWDWVANAFEDPNPVLNELREQTWIASSDRGLEVLRYEDVSKMLRDRNLQKQPQRVMNRMDEMGITEGPVREYHARSILTQDGDPHARLRLPLSAFFAPRRVESLRQATASIVDRALARVAGRPTIDALPELCEPIPAEMFCHLIAAPPELAGQVARISDSMIGPIIDRGSDRAAEHVAAFHELHDLLAELIAERRRAPGDDVLSDLIEMQRTGQLTEQDLYDQAGMLLDASIDNTAHQLTFGLAQLLDERKLLAAVTSGASTPALAADEVLRLAAIAGAILRFPKESFEYKGMVFPAGQPIFLHLRSANRDPRVFENPDAFVPDRPKGRGPLTFGAGAHTCLGQHLARTELQELISRFPVAFPNAELAEPATVSFGPIATRVQRCVIALDPA
ncbi:cytochrome P450 [Rhodococcus pseudokoreensis]|uniref:Cytochrome P450 n=1 Tax=Rhodococcus pseudokoreensis TaxID=2811421 RepID=A0A974W4V2_9NOCA|nr:cytochrome P450 [Rhodococcus pseudokoreensis]QSE90652.1 cytochrome P450 [Rhodococcus pseudokoreensis]